MLVSRREVEADYLLPLVLVRLVVGIGNLEPVAGEKQIEVERVMLAGLKIDAVEDGLVVADVVHGVEFGAIQEAARAVGVEYDEISQLGAAEAERGLFADGAKRAVVGVELSERLFPEPGPRHPFHHQAGLIAILRGRRPGDHFHVLKRVFGHLGRKGPALLVADGLAVHHVAGLRVVSLRMEEAVGIGDYSGRAECNQVRQAGAGGRQVIDDALVDIVVRGRIEVENRVGLRLYVNGGGLRPFDL